MTNRRDILKNFYRDENGDITKTAEQNIDALSEVNVERTFDQFLAGGSIEIKADGLVVSRSGRGLN